MKVMTILGTRPEIIRLSLVIPKLDQHADTHILVHTGQNVDPMLSDVFFDEMSIRQPDYHVQLNGYTFGQQIAQMFSEIEPIIVREQPERILVLGDTNSALCAVLGERLGVPVFHMEAGNRCYDRQVPEEINRRVIDSISSCNMPYSFVSRENLLRDGIPPNRIWISGNPIYEVIQHYWKAIQDSPILRILNLEHKKYILVTTHRAENVDNELHLRQIIEGLHLIACQSQLPIVCSIHPRTHNQLTKLGLTASHPLIQFHSPFGFYDFIKLQNHAACVVTDSGTVQEESCILGTAAVTIRQSTERPETIICGSNMLSGLEPKRIASSVQFMLRMNNSWVCPEGYLDLEVSNKVVNFVLGGQSYVS